MQGIDQNEMLESCFECLDLRVLTLYFSQLKIILRFFWKKDCNERLCFKDFPGGPVADSTIPMQGAQVQFLVRELDPACCN